MLIFWALLVRHFLLYHTVCLTMGNDRFEPIVASIKIYVFDCKIEQVNYILQSGKLCQCADNDISTDINIHATYNLAT